MLVSRTALSVLLAFMFLVVAFVPFASHPSANTCTSGPGPNEQTSWTICVPDMEVISTSGSITISVTVDALTPAAAAYTFTLQAVVGGTIDMVYYGCTAPGDCSHTFTFPGDFSDYSYPLPTGSYIAFGGILGVAGQYGSYTVSSSFVTPEFPLGSLLAVIAPLGALGLYMFARQKLLSAPVHSRT